MLDHEPLHEAVLLEHGFRVALMIFCAVSPTSR